MRTPKQALRLLAVAGLCLVLLATPAQADILLEFDDLIFGAEGGVRTVGQAEVAEDLVGRSCQISVIAENQASVHPGNDLIVSTGDSRTVIVGVEDEVNGGTVETYQVVVGPSIVVQLRFGEDEMSSLGFGLSFDCDQPVPTTADPSLDGQQATAGTSSTTVTPTTSATAPRAGIAASCDDGTGDTTAPSGLAEVGAVSADDACADPTAAQSPGPAPSTTTTAPPATVAPTSIVSTTVAAPAPSAAATPALPPSPVASAIVAAPAYAG